jgi:hypothetical protein
MSEKNLLGERDNEFDVEAAVKKMQHYWETYPNQSGYKDYNENMFLRDALYGVGIAIDASLQGHAKRQAYIIMEAMEAETRANIYRFKRAFTRNVGRGMKVQFGRTVNPSVGVTVDHYELEMPGYRCTNNGPEIIDISETEFDE